jgi:hypothetical protein
MFRVIARVRGIGKEIEIARLLFKIFHAPGAPERFDLSFREIHFCEVRERKTSRMNVERFAFAVAAPLCRGAR